MAEMMHRCVLKVKFIIPLQYLTTLGSLGGVTHDFRIERTTASQDYKFEDYHHGLLSEDKETTIRTILTLRNLAAFHVINY
ncbi:MAG: hypothetical protein Crog4KO_36810 [Crocinitomicaceae bacterium]